LRLLLDEMISPRIGKWVKTLTELLTEHTDVDSLRNQVHHLL
jgi:hypothetical protein